MTSLPPLQITNLSKSFQQKRKLGSVHAVSDVSFTVNTGEIVGFIGHNGAGKTTTIKCALGLLKPTSGEVTLWGNKPASPNVRKRLGYIPENPDYDDSFSPMEYLSMFSQMRGIEGDTTIWNNLLKRVGLENWENTIIRQFSKGMKQRMSLAIALQSTPDLLILDEPTGGLDPIARKEFRDIILEENKRGATIFLSSHILSEVETLCNNAVILVKGKLMASGTLQELLGEEHQYKIVFIHRKTGEEIEELVPETVLQERIDALRQDNIQITSVHLALKSLEDVFLSKTEGEK